LEIVYGVEMRSLTGHPSGFIYQIVENTADLANVIDRDRELVIVHSKLEAEQLAAFYELKEMLEETYTLYRLDAPSQTALFTDYGFTSSSEVSYLYVETTIPFRITNGEEEAIRMALYQIEEHLIAVDGAELPIYFVDRQQKELIDGFANAYKIKAEFLV
jgi:hypothetical protein